jgi:hypothetical protein
MFAHYARHSIISVLLWVTASKRKEQIKPLAWFLVIRGMQMKKNKEL